MCVERKMPRRISSGKSVPSVIAEPIQEIINCTIILDDKLISNNRISGYVTITPEKEVVIKPAVIEIRGTAECRFKSDKVLMSGMRLIKKNTEFTASEEFYFARRTLCGADLPHKQSEREAYPFDFYWHSRMPGTFIGDHGTVRYRLTVRMEIAGHKEAFMHTEEVVLGTWRNLQLEEYVLFESRTDVHRQFRCWRKVGAVEVSVWLPISGIAVGQSLPVLCTVANNTNLHFGGLVFVLTRLDVYTSQRPVAHSKTVRTDVSRVPRPAHIHQGVHHYYCVLGTAPGMLPTNQFYNCSCLHTRYEVWVSVQGAFGRYGPLGYPNIDTPGATVVIGTQPIRNFDINAVSARVLSKIYAVRPTERLEEFYTDEEAAELINYRIEELDAVAIRNLERQLEADERTIIVEERPLDGGERPEEALNQSDT